MEASTLSANVNENPCQACMPLGAALAFKGLERSMVIIHGSQGCATYMRRHISEHFNEPLDIASSSLNEEGTVYGGEKNLKQGLDNVIRLYNPHTIGILTTCLAETIGEDIARIGSEYQAGHSFPGLSIISVPTPGYGGSHSEGYFLALRRIVEQEAQAAGPRLDKLNVVVPNISPADIRELKRLLALLGIDYILLPDFSDTLDSPWTRPYQKIPPGGTSRAEVRNMSRAMATLEFGTTLYPEHSPGVYLEQCFGVPLFRLPLPVGLEACDQCLAVLRHLSGRPLPSSIGQERGRLLDAMIDAHKHNAQGRAVVFGEPENVLAATLLCLENGILPAVVATGSSHNLLLDQLRLKTGQFGAKPRTIKGADFTTIRRAACEEGVNLAIGPSDGRFLSEREGIPLVRSWFPIHDRIGGQRLLSLGFTGSAFFLDRITNTLLESKYTGYRQRLYHQFYSGAGQGGG